MAPLFWPTLYTAASWYIRDKTSSDLDDFVAHATYLYLFFIYSTVASQREPCTLYVAYTASRFTTTHNETPRERESPDIETLLEHSNSSEKKVLIRFYSIRQFYKFAACTLIFK